MRVKKMMFINSKQIKRSLMMMQVHNVVLPVTVPANFSEDEVTGLLNAQGNPRLKALVNRIVNDVARVIEDLDVTPDEFWKAVDYLNRLGGRNEAGLLAAGLPRDGLVDLSLRPDLADAVTADGDVVVPLDTVGFGVWLKAAFGAPVTTGLEPGPFIHVFTSGGWDLPSLSVETAMPEVPRYALVTGCVLDQLSWQMARSGLLTATARLVAQGETVAAATAAGGMPWCRPFP